MRKDHRPFALKRFSAWLEARYIEHFVRPQLEAMGRRGMIMKPWNFYVHGPGISLGDEVHVVTGRDRPVRITTWHSDQQPQVLVGDFALLCPGVRIDCANHITIGANTMLAAGVYVTDADWHDLYDRAQPIGANAPVNIGNNVWLGDGTTVCKGVSIGDNTVVGAASVVTRSLPENVVAAGNPAQVVKTLDPSLPLATRADTLASPDFAERMLGLERYVYGSNGWLNYIRTLLAPGRND